MKNSLETRLGLFFALALLATVFILEMSGGLDYFKPSYQLYARFNTVLELKEGDQVKMAGKQIGRVQSIGFDGDKVKVVLRLEKEFAVKTDSKATIKFAGLMGQNFVSINIGSPKSPAFQGNAEIEVEEQADFSTLMKKVDNAAAGIEKMTQSFSGDSIQDILGPLTDFVKQNSPKLTVSFDNLQKISTQISDGKGTVGKLIMDDELHNSAVATINIWSPWRRAVFGDGTNPLPPRTTMVTLAPGGRRSSNTSTPCSRDAGPTVTCRTSAPSSSSGVDSTWRSSARSVSVTPSLRATQGRVGPWTSVKITTRTKTRSKSHPTSGVSAVIGTVASTTGTPPRNPAQDRNAWSRHGTLNGVNDSITDSGLATRSSTRPIKMAGTMWAARLAGEAKRPNRTNSQIWASQTSPCANPLTAARCGNRMFPSTRADRYAARKPLACTSEPAA